MQKKIFLKIVYIKRYTTKKNIFFENNRKSNKILYCVDFILNGSFEDIGIFHVFQLSFDRVISTHNRYR